MNVLFIDQIAKAGYIYTFSLAQELINKEINLTLVIDQKQDEQERLKETGCEIHHLFNTDEKNIGKVKKFRNYISAFKKIEKLIEKEHIDVLHIQWVILSPLDYLILKQIKKKYGVRIVQTIHDILPFNEHFYDKYYHKKIYALSDALIIQAEGNIQRFNELFPEDKDKVHLIPLGNSNQFVKEGNGQRLREKYEISDSDFVLLFIGQIKKVKGVDVLLRAFKRVIAQHDDIKLIIAGNPWKDDVGEYQGLIDEIKEKNTNQLITDFRFIPDEEIADYYDVADVVVLPYTDVYQSGVIRLTYSYKKPVIATKLPAFMEIVEEGVNGFLCEAGDENTLEQSIERAYEVREKLPRMGECGCELLSQEYGTQMIADKVIELYKS